MNWHKWLKKKMKNIKRIELKINIVRRHTILWQGFDILLLIAKREIT